MTTVIAIVLLFIAAASNAIGDTLKSNFGSSIFKNLNPYFWNPDISWINKWSDRARTKERFLGSTTVFVFVTDAFHFSKSVTITCLAIAIALGSGHYWCIYAVMLKVIWGLGFEIMYRTANKK